MATNFKVKTERNPAYLRWLLTQPCIACGRQSEVYHHLKTGGMGIKCSDMDAAGLCHNHHAEIHQHYGKRGWWTDEQIDQILMRLHHGFKLTIDQ